MDLFIGLFLSMAGSDGEDAGACMDAVGDRLGNMDMSSPRLFADGNTEVDCECSMGPMPVLIDILGFLSGDGNVAYDLLGDRF
jgi:hypothetical protein